jgi:hypothetical protein
MLFNNKSIKFYDVAALITCKKILAIAGRFPQHPSIQPISLKKCRIQMDVISSDVACNVTTDNIHATKDFTHI